jgi:hypothetical protein
MVGNALAACTGIAATDSMGVRTVRVAGVLSFALTVVRHMANNAAKAAVATTAVFHQPFRNLEESLDDATGDVDTVRPSGSMCGI